MPKVRSVEGDGGDDIKDMLNIIKGKLDNIMSGQTSFENRLNCLEEKLLTEEDHESPFLSLSSGTLLGEVAALHIHTSKVSIRCNTYCEVQSLNLVSFYRMLLEFPEVTKSINALYHKRIQYAKWATSDQVPKYDTALDGSERATTVMKLKNQWKAISAFHNKGRKQDIDWSKIDRSFSSNYLNTLVITDSTGLKKKVICLSSDCPFVLEPDSSFKRFLNYMVTAAAIGGNVNLSTHQARMKQFLAFAKDLLLEETLTQSVVQHYEHVWKATLGTSISIISSKFNLYLRIQFVCFLYEASLRNTKLFAYAPPAIIQRLAPCLNEVHFKRGGIIIRCNDVQKYLYFVYKGEVDIIVADTVLTTLGVGGVFGCFHKSGIFRQTFTAIGRTHTILLTLNSIKLNEITQEWDDKQSEDVLKQIRFIVSCLQTCYHCTDRIGRPIAVTNSSDSALVGYTYTINILSTTGMRETIPYNMKQLAISIFMALYAQIMIASMASGLANMVIIDQNTMANFEHKITKMKIYLTGRHLSPALLTKVWEYYILLWKLQKGECLPILITEAPSYLKQDVMLHLFGYHLENHFLFAKTHKDFIRQLVTLFERRVFLPGNVVVEKGDMDSTMYFIHSGEVGAFDRQGSEEKQCYVLHSDMSFGEAQGIYNIPYKMTYKALAVTFILALRQPVWMYLLKWFPASDETITREAIERNLKDVIYDFSSYGRR
ncbi:cyclic nucleotide-gated cation channel subunit a [Holotrichia oblita]|uniref:Cyclic nucleotide-gated cation channel subunit a n=1 Tax=Holotrichia oblita TaxID=644536 RepID=A0ACB9TUN0_HOLOL|nr:cyclic nucleotide-gated cation channel subunit a [Holotrichia oblita]